MAQVDFDIAGQLDLRFRRARAGSKTLTFLDVDEEEYDISGITFQLNVKTNERASTNVFQLTSGSGLSIATNVMTVSVTENQSDLAGDMYWWELYDSTNKKTWLCGRAYFTLSEPSDLEDSNTVTVDLDPDTVQVNITTDTINIDGGTA